MGTAESSVLFLRKKPNTNIHLSKWLNTQKCNFGHLYSETSASAMKSAEKIDMSISVHSKGNGRERKMPTSGAAIDAKLEGIQLSGMREI